MNPDLLAALARLHVADVLDQARKRRAFATRENAPYSARAVAAATLRSVGTVAIVLGDAVAPRATR